LNRSIKALTASAYLSMFFLGISNAVIGAAARNIGLTPFQIGLFLTVQNIGFMIGVSVAGALSDSYDKPRILFAGSLILAVSFFTFYLTGVLWLNLIIMLLIGLGVGSYEGVTDPMLLEMHEERQSLHINVNHFFVTFGSILMTVYLIFLQMNWRRSLTEAAVVVLLLAVFFAFARLKNKPGQAGDYLERLRILSRERLVVVLFVATLLVVGVELGTTGIVTTYLMELQGFTQETSKIGLLTFLVGMASGRLIVGFFARSDQAVRHILLLFGLATIFFGLMVTLRLGEWSYITIFLAGLAMSALVPLIITLAGQSYPQMAGTVTGSIKVAIPIGGIVIPFIMSLVAEAASLQAALLVFPLALLLAFVLLWFALRRTPAPA
jgi:FHS family glucose/mannose:H+ symporter-like MFS transporter